MFLENEGPFLMKKNSISSNRLPEKLAFIVPVWGEYHTKVFIDIVLPSYLTDGNLKALGDFACVFQIYTDSVSAAKIKKSAAFKKLVSLCKDVVFKEVNKLPSTNQHISVIYKSLKEIHVEGIKTRAPGAAIFFLNADTVYADGSFETVINLLKEGYRSVELVTLRTNGNYIIDHLLSMKKMGVLSVSPLALTEIASKYLHKISKQHFWNSNEDRLIPDNIYWNVDNEGILARCTHFHPLMVYPKVPNPHFTGTIDHDFIENAGIQEHERFIVKDNSKIAGIEISPAFHSQELPFYSPRRAVDIAVFLQALCTKKNKNNLNHKVLLKFTNAITQNKWRKVEANSDKLISDVMHYFHEDYACKPFSRSREFHVRILIPLWGQSYIDNFCELSLPSLLAEGNLPYLNEKADLEIVFLTTKSSKEYILDKFFQKNILDIFSIKFLFIDDLLKFTHYGIILTSAYARGFEDAGENQTNIHFFLLNADFILSKNTYKTMYKYIEKGYNAVLISTLRANEETALPILREMTINNDDILEVSGRDLAGMTLKHLHNTVRANIVNKSSIMHHGAVNQLFYQVNPNILIGRFFLLFMGYIKPEKPLKYISGFCDYTFVADLCPSGNFEIIRDSDDGYILELQKEHHEGDYIKFGAPKIADLASILSEWTNKEHRFYGTHNIIIHSESLPDKLSGFLKKFDEYMEKIYSLISTEPKPVHSHHYWRGSITSLPISGHLNKEKFIHHYQKNFFRMNYDYYLLKEKLEDELEKFSEKKILIIRLDNKEYDFYIHKFMKSHPKAEVRIHSLIELEYNMVLSPENGFDLVILLVTHSLEKIINNQKKVLKKIGSFLSTDGTLLLALQSQYFETSIDFTIKKFLGEWNELELTSWNEKFTYGHERLQNIHMLHAIINKIKNKNKNIILDLINFTNIQSVIKSCCRWLILSLKISKQNTKLNNNTVKELESKAYVTAAVIQLKRIPSLDSTVFSS